jgi:uncharacterized membrane-anchored protein
MVGNRHRSVRVTSNTDIAGKVPAVTLSFWIVKILATTLGETGGDTVSMTLAWGYLAGSVLFLSVLTALVAAQIASRTFRPFLYWATIVASTTAGTTMADFADRSLGIGYAGGSLLLLACLLGVLAIWYRSMGTISVDHVVSRKSECFYWAAITLSQTLGTALGDWIADDSGLGYLGGALVFAAAIAAVVVAYFTTSLSRVMLFWTAFILTRPLGATLGDFFDKPLDAGGLDVSRPVLSIGFVILIAALVWLLPQKAAVVPRSEETLDEELGHA